MFVCTFLQFYIMRHCRYLLVCFFYTCLTLCQATIIHIIYIKNIISLFQHPDMTIVILQLFWLKCSQQHQTRHINFNAITNVCMCVAGENCERREEMSQFYNGILQWRTRYRIHVRIYNLYMHYYSIRFSLFPPHLLLYVCCVKTF